MKTSDYMAVRALSRLLCAEDILDENFGLDKEREAVIELARRTVKLVVQSLRDEVNAIELEDE